MFGRTGALGNLRKSRSVDFLTLRVIISRRSGAVPRFKGSRTIRLLVPAILVFFVISAFSRTREETWTDKTLRSLTLREKIAQLVQIRVPGKFINRRGPEFQAIREQIRQYRVGGVVLFAGNVYESAILLNELQTISKLPLLVAADFERGASFRIADTTSFPWAMALGATGSESLAYQQGAVTAQESRALGVHWIFAPVMDVNNNPDNPVINVRSFGEDPGLVARLGSAFIRGARKAGVLTTAKHFPGHGDTTTNTHLGLAVVESDMARLQSIEFAPFRSAIEAGVDSIMTAHVAVPKVTSEQELPSTLSSKILTEVLRNTLKFNGLVVTDALDMAGITNRYWCGLAAIRAIQAGADILLLPPDAAVAINEVERAVRRGDISEARIDQSVRRILNAKNNLGLPRNRLVSVGRIGEVVASPQNRRLAQEIADHSITVLKDALRLLPINPAGDARVFSLALASDFESSPGAVFQAEMRRRFPSVRTAWGNARVSNDLLAAIDANISEADLIVCSTLVRLNSDQDAISIPESQRGIFKKLVASGKPVIWVAFGNPYVLRLAPEIGTYLCTFSYSDVSQVAAAKALAGEILISGKMPVSIPGHSNIGDGLQVPRLEMTLKPLPPESFGLSKNAFEKTRQLLTSFADAGVIPGSQLLVGFRGAIALEFAVGKVGDAADSAKVTDDTAYDLASLSKLVGVASAAMLAMESGALLLDAPIKDYIPEFQDTGSEKICARDLLNAFSDKDKAAAGTSRADVNLLENMVSRATGLSLGRFLTKRLFEPLGMKCSLRIPPPPPHVGAAYSGASEDVRVFCSAQDLAPFAQMLLNRGIYSHHRYFSPETMKIYAGSQGPWSKPSSSDWTGKLLSPSAFGHSASGGSFIWIDPAKNLFVVFLTSGAKTQEGISGVQAKIAESIITAISDWR
jgi:beta-N-acetylhexosaminidase